MSAARGVLAAGLIVLSAALALVAAGTVPDPVSVVARTPSTGDVGWTIVVVDTVTGRTDGVFAGPGDGPAIVPGTGFTENYVAQVRRVQAAPALELRSSMITGATRVDTTLRPSAVPSELGIPAVVAAGLGLLAAAVGAVARTRRAARGLVRVAAGGVGATAAVLATLGADLPLVVLAALAAVAGALALVRDGTHRGQG